MTKITILPKENPNYPQSSLGRKTSVTFNVKNFRTAVLMALFIFSFPKLHAQTVFINPASPFVVPADVVGLKVECWGGGGAGGGSQNTFLTTRFGGGGGGGGYSVSTLTASPGQNYTISIGAGGAPASNANGGNGGTTTVSGPGGSVSAGGGGGGVKSTAATGGTAGVGNTRNGGTGGTGASSTGGSGGGGAGNAANGGNGNTSTAGAGGAGSPNAAPYKGGNGGAPNILFSNSNGNAPGGGGSGGLSNTGTSSGGSGAAGQVVITLIYPAPIVTSFATSSACAGGNITINGSNLNNATAVTVGGTAVASITSNTTTQIVAKLGSGTTGTVSVTTLGGTGTSSQTFSVTPLPAAPATTNGSKCGIGSITLSATPAVGATTCNWYSAATGGTLLSAGTTNATLTLAASGNTTYYVSSLTSDGCESTTRTSVTATAKPEVTASATTSLASGCVPFTATVTGAGTSIAKNTVATSIPDNDIFNGDVPVTTFATVSGISGNLDNTNIKISYVKININHTYISDLQVRLMAPDGSVLNLSNQHGGSGANYTNTTFITGSPAITSSAAPFTGNFSPDVAFSTFNGKNPNGNWGLNVIDKQWLTFAPTGTIVNWEIGFTDNNGLTYSWTSTPAGFTAATRIATVAPTVATSYSITTSNAQSCSASSAVSISINAPADITASGGGSICVGNAISLSADNIAPGQLSGNTYLWSGPNSFSSTQQSPQVGAATLALAGVYGVTVTNQFLCTASTVVSVIVNTNPIVSVSSQQIESCPGAMDGVMEILATDGTPSYDFTYDFINFNQSGVFTDLGPGSYDVYVSDANGCTGTVNATILSPNLAAALVCPGNQEISITGSCSTTVNYSVPATGIPVPEVSYAFSGVTTGSGNGDGSGSVFNIGTTTVTVTATNSCGTDICSFDVVVTDAENPVISCPANIAFCNPTGTAVTFNVTATDNCSIASIVSTPASGSIFPVGTTTVNNVATDVNGNTSSCSFTVTISTPSTAPTAVSTDAANNNICLGNSVVLTVNGGSLGTGASYMWYTGSCGGTLAGTGASITKSPTATTTYYVRAEGACNTTSCASVTVTVSTSPVTSLALMPFTGMPANVCAGTVATLSIAPVNRATFYVWDVPTGSYFNGNPLNVSPFTTTTPSVTVTFDAPSGSLYNIGVQAGNACGSSVRQSQKVRGLTSVPASISGSTTACVSSTVNYTTTAVTGASSYLWTITGNATVSGTGTTATVTFGSGWTGGTLCVAAQTTCYTSPAKCITIGTSASTLNAISGTFTACPNSTLSYSVPASSGAASYTWSLPPGASIAAGQGTNSVSVNYGAGYSAVGSVCVSVTSTCGVTSAQKCKTVAPGIPQQPASISGALSGVCNQSMNYQCPSSAGNTYSWTVPSGASVLSGQGSNAVNIQFATMTTGPVCVTASNSCGNSTSRCITVKGAPASPSSVTPTPSSWCANTQGIEFVANTTTLTGSFTLSWTYPSTPIATYVLGGGNSNSLLLDWGSGSGNVIVNAFNSCGSGSKQFTATVSCRDGVNEINAGSFDIYPNPSAGNVTVEFAASKGKAQIYLVDIAGRTVFTQTIQTIDGQNYFNSDFKNLAKGSYILNLNNGAEVKQEKIVLN